MSTPIFSLLEVQVDTDFGCPMIYLLFPDMNYTTHNEGSVIRCAEFHPTNAIGLVAGINGTASLFEIDGKMNRKLKSIHLENFPIKTAHFTANGKQFLAGSQQYGHFFAYDLTKDKVIRIPWKEDREQHTMQKFEVSLTQIILLKK